MRRAFLRLDASFLSLFLVISLTFGLSACSAYEAPSKSVLLDALQMEIELTNSTISKAIELPPVDTSIVRILKVDSYEGIPLEKENIRRFTGLFDWQTSVKRSQPENSFELFLEREEKSDSWRLARPIGSLDGVLQDWKTYPLTIND